MKKIIAIAITLLAVNTLAINTSRTWKSGFYKLQFAKTTARGFNFDSKQAAVNAALDLASSMQSGTLSNVAKRVLRDTTEYGTSRHSCEGSVSNYRQLAKQMAAGKFSVNEITVNSYFNAAGVEIFGYRMRLSVPCVIKD